MKVYTRKGDDGKTDLNSKNLDKDHRLLKVLGNLDELNSSLGLLHAIRNKKIKHIILSLQDDLFSIGTNMSNPKREFFYDKKTQDLENYIDELSRNLPPLRNFIIPGGSKNSALLHLSRTIARRLERSLETLKKAYGKDKPSIKGAIKYINRLSDLLFVMARYVNFKLGIKEVIWPYKE